MTKEEFSEKFADFYSDFFEKIAESISELAVIQVDYGEEYDSIVSFASDQSRIDSLLDGLNPKNQTVILRILLKAGSFNNRLANIFNLSPEEKNQLSSDLKKFVKEIKSIKSIKSD